MTIKTEVEMFPQIYNWQSEIKLTGCLYPNGTIRWVYLRWYERPNEDNLLNTLTEALEGAYDYD